MRVDGLDRKLSLFSLPIRECKSAWLKVKSAPKFLGQSEDLLPLLVSAWRLNAVMRVDPTFYFLPELGWLHKQSLERHVDQYVFRVSPGIRLAH